MRSLFLVSGEDVIAFGARKKNEIRDQGYEDLQQL
jgi:hypothetical protein